MLLALLALLLLVAVIGRYAVLSCALSVHLSRENGEDVAPSRPAVVSWIIACSFGVGRVGIAATTI